MPRWIILPLFACLLLSGCAQPRQIDSGVLEGRQLWSGRIEIHGDVELAAGSELVIAAGSDIVFYPPRPGEDRFTEHPNFAGSELILRGRVRALGTPSRPIVFRAAEPAAPAGSWGGVNISESPEAIFSYVLFRQADSALHIQESTAFIEQSVFLDNQVGLRFHSSQLLAENNLFERNGTAVRFHYGAPVLCRNLFRNNHRALFVTAYPLDYRIEANCFEAAADYQVVLGEEVPDAFHLEQNAWWSSDNAAIAQSFYDGRRDPYLGRILFLPRADNPGGCGPEWQP